MSDITDIKRELTAKAAQVAEYLLPNGRREKNEWVCGSVHGNAGDSLKVAISGNKVGVWSDFADGEGGDLIDLWRAAKRITLPDALNEIRDWLGMPQPTFGKTEKVYAKPKPVPVASHVGAVYEYLTKERGLSSEVIGRYRVTAKQDWIVFPSYVGEELRFAKYLNIHRPDGKKDMRAEKDCEPVLFGWQSIPDGAREVCINEGEIDSMTVAMGNLPALSVPFGAGGGNKQQWIEREFDRLAQFEVIYLCFDPDDEGQKAIAEIAPRLGLHRCRMGKLPHKDPNECLKQGMTPLQIVDAIRRWTAQDPEQLRRASDYREDVRNLFYPKPGEKIGYSMPYAGYHDKIRFRPHELTIWSGASGDGKTQILNDCSVEWINQQARICMASLEMRGGQSMKRMVKQAGCVDRPTDNYLDAIVDWLDEGLWFYSVVGKSGVDPMLEVFDYARARYGCDVFIIDSLMRLGIGSEDYEGQEKAVYKLVEWAVANPVHVHLVAHARKADKNNPGPGGTEDIKGASEIGANAFNILHVWRNRKLEEEIARLEKEAANGDEVAKETLVQHKNKSPVTVNVSKQRNGDWEGKIGLWFNQRTYQYRTWECPKGGRRYVDFSTANRQVAE